jgi:hypothetical protein
MKKIAIVIGCMVHASSIFAMGSPVCSAATSAGDGNAIDGDKGYVGASGGSGFVINTFTPKCSANVHAAVQQNETVFAVAAGSKKGRNMFSGSTNGGGVKPEAGASYPNGVANGNVMDAATTALAAATSS